jgi:hypothetical protein
MMNIPASSTICLKTLDYQGFSAFLREKSSGFLSFFLKQLLFFMNLSFFVPLLIILLQLTS